MCQMDVQSSGMLPAHAFSILLIMFLQQESNPVLPCIHDHIENQKSEVYKSKISKTYFYLSISPNIIVAPCSY